MTNNHVVIVIPGLGDAVQRLSLLTHHWTSYGLTPIVYPLWWYDKKDFNPKLNALITLIDQYIKNGDKISLVGASAGASAVLNAFIERKDNIHKIIAVCGRLRMGDQRGFRSFLSRTKESQSFAQSVQLFEGREHELTNNDKEKIMTVHALFGDELVPADTATLAGAHNIVVPMFEHVLSIALSLTLFSKPLIEFLTTEK